MGPEASKPKASKPKASKPKASKPKARDVFKMGDNVVITDEDAPWLSEDISSVGKVGKVVGYIGGRDDGIAINFEATGDTFSFDISSCARLSDTWWDVEALRMG